MTTEQFLAVYKNADLLCSKEQVEAALDDLAAAITAKLQDRNPLVLCVMVGGLIPAGHLLTRLKFPLQVDYIHASRYRGQTAGGELKWIAKSSISLKEREVLLIDDIFDEGWTLEAIINACYNDGAKEVYSAVLIDKVHSRKCNIRPTFVGLKVEDRYLFGCGMDYKEYFRNLFGIYAVNEHG